MTVGSYRIDAKVMAEMVKMDAEQRAEIERVHAVIRRFDNRDVSPTSDQREVIDALREALR